MLKNQTDKSSLRQYQKLLNKARVKLRLKMSIRLRRGQGLVSGWYFDLKPDRKAAVIICPSFKKENVPAFLHYLCSAKILENGWPRPDIKPTLNKIYLRKLKNLPPDDKGFLLLYWVSRPADSLLDFYAFQLVAKKFGLKYFRQFTKNVTDRNIGELLECFDELYRGIPLPFPVYTFCIDWFAMFYVLSGNIDKSIQKKLGKLFNALLKTKKFRQKTFPVIDKKIKTIRNFYEQLIKKYPTYRGFLKSASESRKIFSFYCRNVWAHTGLKIRFNKIQ